MAKVNLLEKIKELKKEYQNYEIDIDCLCDYSENRFLCDVINQISDNNVDIYNYDLFEWCKYNYEYVNQAIEEFGNNNDILQTIREGQFLYYNELIYQNLSDFLKVYTYNLFIINNYEEINETTYSQLQEIIENMENEDYLASFEDIIEEIEGEI